MDGQSGGGRIHANNLNAIPIREKSADVLLRHLYAAPPV